MYQAEIRLLVHQILARLDCDRSRLQNANNRQSRLLVSNNDENALRPYPYM